jgi:DNA-directed RNA polymerase subunit RPC12/RpoP
LSTYIVCNKGSSYPVWNLSAQIRILYGSSWIRAGIAEEGKPLTASDVFAGSPTRFYWQCPANHEYLATASNRSANGSKCPLCSHRLVVAGINDLATTHPELARQLHPTKNFVNAPTLSAGSDQILFWICDAGHIFKRSVGNRTRGAGFHFCTRTSEGTRLLHTQRPEIAAEFHQYKNPGAVETLTIGSRKSYVWQCPAGHEYSQRVERRVAGYGCPVCSHRALEPGVNDVATRYPWMCAEWHQAKNGVMEPSDIMPGTRIWNWKCLAAGHLTQQSVPNRVKSLGCTQCPVELRLGAAT